MGRPKQTVESFWAKVDRRTPDACWEWTSKRNKYNYGRVRWNGKYYQAHRVAYALGVSPISFRMERDEYVIHTCDNPPCCNPNHLVLADNSLNMLDMYKKKRENNTRKKLTDEQIREVRRTYVKWSSGPFNLVNLAKRYGVALKTIHFAIIGETYKNVE